MRGNKHTYKPRYGARKVCEVALVKLLQEGKNNTEIAMIFNVTQPAITMFIQRLIPPEVYSNKLDSICDYCADIDSQPGPNFIDLLERLYLRIALEEVLAKISPKEDFVLRRRYGLDGDFYTLEEVGEVMGLTKERVRQIETRGLNRIRAFHRDDLITFLP